jgi:zinc/manganese transport system substrate-binding protein
MMAGGMFKWISPLLAFLLVSFAAASEPISIVAAENFYGDVARQIGGAGVAVTAILSSPDQDPHLFEASPSTARLLAGAKLVIVNGAGYDPWMEALLASSSVPGRREIVVAALVGAKPGDNPHIWYDPATIEALAARLAADLSDLDPANGAEYRQRGAAFAASLKLLGQKIAAMKARYGGAPVTASEPVFGAMAKSLGLEMRNQRFQLAIQNDAEPSVSDVAAFEDDLRGHKVRVMIYNAQANGPAARRLVKLAKDEKIPVVGVSETAPAQKTYQEWMLSQLDALDRALDRTLGGPALAGPAR